MELIKILNSHAFAQWIAEALAIFFLLGGFVALAVGLGLFFRTQKTLRLFDSMNRWVSMRRTTRPLEMPRDTRPAVLRHRRLIAATFILGDGQIVVSGPIVDRGRNDRTDTFAVVGGSGAYTAARGTMVTTETRRRTRFVFTFAG